MRMKIIMIILIFGFYELFLICLLARVQFFVYGEEVLQSTPDSSNYIILSTIDIKMSGARFINFKVKACHDAHVALISGNTENDPLYEIVIGGWGNTKSVIRTRKQGNPVKTSEVRVLDCHYFVEVWISWTNVTIKVGHGLVEDPTTTFLEWSDQNGLLTIVNAGFYTAFGSTGEWIFFRPDTTTAVESDTKQTTSCQCPCSQIGKWSFLALQNLTKEELTFILHDEVEAIKKSLIIDKKSSTNYIRGKTSAPDPRKSSRSFGFLGIIFICVPVIFIIVSDVLNLYLYLTAR